MSVKQIYLQKGGNNGADGFSDWANIISPDMLVAGYPGNRDKFFVDLNSVERGAFSSSLVISRSLLYMQKHPVRSNNEAFVPPPLGMPCSW